MPETTVTEFGARLKQARLARGVSLAQIASVTKISVRSLEAVERNDFSRLPGGIYTRAFVRAYADEVGLDPEVALKHFLSQCPDDVAAVPTSAPESIDGPSSHAEWQEKLTPRHVAVALLALALAVAAWYAWSRAPRPEAALPTSEPLVEAPLPAPPSAVASQPATVPVSSAPVAVAPEVAVPTPVSPSSPLSVDLVASSDCWMFVSADGTPSPSRVYTKGERVSVSATREVILKVGDASAVALTINGRQAAPLGAAGRVVTVRLTPETWTSFVAQR
jgi:cytoskeletal protein RodZ